MGKCHSYSEEKQEGRPKELQDDQPHLNAQEDDDKINPGKYFQEMKNKKIIQSGQYGFTKAKPCWTNLIAFQNAVSGQVDGLVQSSRCCLFGLQ